MGSYLDTTDTQFAFKKCHSADYSIELITGHFLKKLLNQGVPILLVRILLYWYRTQMFCIKWSTSTFSFFNVSKGVHQGGILCPYLFTVYVNDLSNMPNKGEIGCHINNCCANHVFYTDDLCVIAPNTCGLQALLNICSKFGFENYIIYNPVKSICMAVKPRC